MRKSNHLWVWESVAVLSLAVGGCAQHLDEIGLREGGVGQQRGALGSFLERRTFASKVHKNDASIATKQGETRGQRQNFFGLSQADPNFMISTGNMYGETLISTDGKHFEAISATPTGRVGVTFGFHPTDGNVAYGLFSTKTITQGWDWFEKFHWRDGNTPHPYGLYKTTDKGATWSQVLMLPDAITNPTYELENHEPKGKRTLFVSPLARNGVHWVYFGTRANGIIRSRDNGATWEQVAFAGKRVITMSAIHVSTSDVLRIYAIVTDALAPGASDETVEAKEGELWWTRAKADGTMQAEQKIVSAAGDRFVDVEAFNSGNQLYALSEWAHNNPSYAKESHAGVKFYIIDQAHKRLSWYTATELTAAYPTDPNKQVFGAVWVNPYDDNHVVLHMDDPKWGLTYSTDGGTTWKVGNHAGSSVANGRYVDASGYLPDFKVADIGSHTHPGTTYFEADSTNTCGAQGPSVGFVNANTLKFILWTKERQAVVSNDRGATGTYFSTGRETKLLQQLNAPKNLDNYLTVAFGEFGFTTSVNSGKMNRGYQGNGDHGDPVLQQLEAACPGSNASCRMGHGITFLDGVSPLTAIGSFAKGDIIKMTQNGAWNNWDFSDTGFDSDLDGNGGCYGSGMIAYCGNVVTRNGGSSFSKMYSGSKPMMVVAASTDEPQIAVAVTTFRDVTSADAGQIWATIDAGISWVALPKIPNEEAPGHPGVWYSPVMFRNTPHIAIDPDPARDCVADSSARMRVLVPGRRIYEYTAGNRNGSGGTWTTRDSGITGHDSYNDGNPYMSGVVFDPRPNYHGRVYAWRTNSVSMKAWGEAELSDALAYSPPKTSTKPAWVSENGGSTWTQFGAASLPTRMDIKHAYVSDSGKVYFGSSNSGIFVFGP